MSEITRDALLATWLDVVAGHAQRMGDRIAYRFLEGGEAETATLTFAQVDRYARAIAQRLIQHGVAGQRVVLAHPPGLEFVAAFFGCLYAGAVAVPTFPARSGTSGQRFVSRLHAILADATPVLIATTAATAGRVAEVLNSNTVRVIATDDIDLDTADDWQRPAVAGDTLACLQYTSGTSGTPKGVMLTHAAMLANSRQIAERFNSTQQSRGVIWLPPYHDMGLIGGVLQPMYVGFDVVLMPPAAFLQRPFRWMSAISQYKATISGGPCFAFGQTARSISDADFATLDLSSWCVAFTGAERVRAETLSEFAERFNTAKFDAKSFLPCYGMAEATLMISGVKQGAGLSMTDGHVSCGPAAAGTSIAIINQTTGSRVGDGSFGEIWTYGPSVAAGYWKQPQTTADTFAARPKDQSKEYLRTGDLGFMKDGELFVTGRLKELIILRGTNFYPQDIEQTAEAAHGALQPDGSAAFAIDGPAGERLVLVHELRRTERHACPATVVSAIRTKVTTDHGIEVGVVALVGPGQVPRTVSGKIQRTACRDLFLAGKLGTIDVSKLSTPKPATPAIAIAPVDASNDLPGYLAAKLAAVVGVITAEIDIHQPVAAYGIGSADAVGIAGQISNELNIDLPAMALWDYPTLAELAGYVAELLATPPNQSAEGGMSEPAPRQAAADILYNPLRPDFAQNPYPALHRLRAADPVHYSPLLGVWVLTKYADVSAALRDPRLSAAARNWKGYERFFLRPQLESNPLDEMYKRWMLQLDAPDHTRLRALVSSAFTPRAVQHMRGRIRAIVDGLLDAMQAAGSFDAIADFAHPLPVVAIADMLGVPADDHARVKAWSHDLLPSFSPSLSLAALKNVNRALGEFREYFAQLVERRRANPGDDLLSGLINARFEQDKLDDEELFATCILLTFAGHASTVQSISNLLLILANRPEIFAAIRGQPKLLMGAIEEVLRFEAPLQLIYRTTKVEVEIGGKTIAPHEMIFLSLPAANRDPERFADPDTFDPARTDNRHLAFGYGAHFCAGAGLARLETMIAVETFLKRFPAFKMAGAVPPREASLLLRGLTKLPMRVGA